MRDNKRKYTLGKKKLAVVDGVDVERMKMLIDKGELDLFVRIWDTLHYAIFKKGEIVNQDQIDVLNLPFVLWGLKGGFVISEMRRAANGD